MTVTSECSHGGNNLKFSFICNLRTDVLAKCPEARHICGVYRTFEVSLVHRGRRPREGPGPSPSPEAGGRGVRGQVWGPPLAGLPAVRVLRPLPESYLRLQLGPRRQVHRQMTTAIKCGSRYILSQSPGHLSPVCSSFLSVLTFWLVASNVFLT